jgi:hypothetical protein
MSSVPFWSPVLLAFVVSLLLAVAEAPGQSPETSGPGDSRKVVRAPDVSTHRPYEYDDGQTGSAAD